jgi:hypothetical protein
MPSQVVERAEGSDRVGSRRLGVLLGLVTLLTGALVLVPALLLRPFSPQTPAAVAIAYALRTASPWLAPAGALVSVVLAARVLRRRPGRVAAAATIGAASLAGAAVWLGRQNHFEWMFAPLPSAEYARAGDAAFVDPSDMVVAVEVKGDAVAYPVRQMAYHHLLNDQVGGLPVVSTY